ncbi:MAG: DNA polymerase III subunit gamma/tau [Candidatus Omnitrophica bacterium CG08_land_8_20_14_0_20_41_16]|uniref:DNA polymerase III subunit gamma/tau n=1 Tax=Candidatus Sherwoodlollariibacterium unditelluris TaxID=1974757 RepID=A0A2G9YHG2_9BACT|nr:MAG: DNA polymerase III subunit gamma/tau [Candidatus Omnitrophica bacterium CG23_combo_of_CG06-09_8_20_14_all_41_10]PIS33370.1 MAG: DNA polymerase III subunit gamma/tau [Candidatus Omnitrophica bacterium CG08_land_8_20_14_0_20_41_16]
MPYTVFALKWRPNNFDEIVGQPNIVSTLTSAIEKNRLAHAYLFAGPRGVGKTSTARILAKALNCKEGPTVNPCGKCSSCLEISQSRSLDVIEIDGASNTGVEDVRLLRENVKFSPTSGKFKIYIIDEVHMLSTPAFNALLKTLEEPPEFVKFLFATTRPDKIPSTVLSRCQRLDFRRISTLEIISQLDKIAKSEKISVDKEVLFAIAKTSDGALRDAESILDQLVSFSKDKISLKDVISVLGFVEQEALFEITDKIIQNDPKKALYLLNRIIDDGKDVNVFLNNLIEHFRNLMVAKVTKGDAKLIDLPQDICERLLRQAQSLSLEEIFSAFNILANTLEVAKRLDSLRIPLEVSIIRLSHGKKIPEAAVEIKKTSLEQVPPSEDKDLSKEQKTRGEERPKESPEAAMNINLDNVKAVWQNILDSLGRVKISAATYLSEGEPVKLQGNLLTVSFPKSHSLYKESLEKRENREIIEKNLTQALNTPLRINFILSAETKPKADDSGNTFIRSVMDVFGGRVVKKD